MAAEAGPAGGRGGGRAGRSGGRGAGRKAAVTPRAGGAPTSGGAPNGAAASSAEAVAKAAGHQDGAGGSAQWRPKHAVAAPAAAASEPEPKLFGASPAAPLCLRRTPLSRHGLASFRPER